MPIHCCSIRFESAKVGTAMDSEIHSSRRAVVFSYSQTGQLHTTIQAFVEPFLAAGWQMRHVNVEPQGVGKVVK